MKIEAKCFCCGNVGVYEMDEKETRVFEEYQFLGRSMGAIQDLFPNVPQWIRSGAIDQFSGGFCICPECCGS